MSINYINNNDSGLSIRNKLNQIVTTTNTISEIVNTIDINYIDLKDAIDNSKLTPKAYYKVTNADPDLYGGTDVILQASSVSTLNPNGIGKFYNPIYNQEISGYGVWAKHTSFTANDIGYITLYPSLYSGSLTGSYSGSYTGSFTGSFSGSLTGSVGFITGSFTGSYSGSFSGSLSGSFTGSFSGSWEEVSSSFSKGMFNSSIPYGEILIANESQLGNSIGTVFEGDYNFLLRTEGDWSTATEILGESSNAHANITNVFFPTYYVGDTVIWGGKVWINKTGETGYDIDAYTLDSENWEAIEYTNTDYYSISWDEIEYDVENNFITLRKENLSNNIVEQSYQNWINWKLGNRAISGFQWGNVFNSDLSKGLENNYISDSYIELINFRGSVCYQNSFTQYAYIIDNIFEINTEITNNQIINSYIYNNFFGGSSIIFDSNFLVNSNINTNSVLGYSKISNNNFTNTVINQNVLSSGGIIKNTGNNININYNGIFNGSQIAENSLMSGDIACNNLSNQSLIAYNSLNLNSIIANNHLGELSEISKNTLANASQILHNIVNDNGLINNNNISNLSVIYNNSSVDNITNNIFSNYYYLENTSTLTNISFIKVKNIGETVVNEYALNFGPDNTIRSELGITLGSGNYIGGILYNGILSAGDTSIDILEDVTSKLFINDIIYITSNNTNKNITRRVIDVGSYANGVTPIIIDEIIDGETTSVNLSQNSYGINSLALGSNNFLIGNNSIIVGSENLNNTSNSIVTGINGVSKFDTNRVISGQNLSLPGDCQFVEVMLGGTTLGNEIVSLTLNNGKELVLSINDSTGIAYKYKIEILAMETDNSVLFGDAFTQTISGLIVEKGGVLQEIGSQIISETINDPTFGGSIIISADNTNKLLKVQAVGEANKNINWVAKVSLIQTFI